MLRSQKRRAALERRRKSRTRPRLLSNTLHYNRNTAIKARNTNCRDAPWQLRNPIFLNNSSMSPEQSHQHAPFTRLPRRSVTICSRTALFRMLFMKSRVVLNVHTMNVHQMKVFGFKINVLRLEIDVYWTFI